MRLRGGLLFGFLCVALLLPAGGASAAPAEPSWQLSATPLPTHFTPGQEKVEVLLYAANLGAKATSGTITLSDTLPSGVTPIGTAQFDSDPSSDPGPSCGISAQTVTCTDAGPISPGRHIEVRVVVEVAPLLAEGPLPDEVSISGGGAPPATAQATLQIKSSPPPFAILPGFRALPAEEDGSEAALAGSHPYALDLNFDFPTKRHPGGVLLADGAVRDIVNDLPRGEIVNPTATPVRCADAELITEPGCPDASAIGTLTVKAGEVVVKAATFPIYNMIPPPGQAADLGANAFGVGIFIHVKGGVRSDGDFGLSGSSNDILALPPHPVFGVSAELWGDPTNEVHDGIRGHCAFVEAISEEEKAKGEGPPACTAARTKTAMITLPGDCPKAPLVSEVKADSWEEPGQFKQATYNGHEIEGCKGLEFEPSLSVKPTTNLPDAPSGLDVNLHQPQDFSYEHRSPASLKDITLALPEGLVVNPAQAEGLAACTTSQVGLATAVGQSPVHFNEEPDQCPAAAKIGTVTVKSPLLAEYNESGKEPALDPETGKPKLRPVQGSLYIAKPYANPFNSLLAVYLSINDTQSGVVAKLAGEVHADPKTGRLVSKFSETPELPLEDTEVHLFGGSRGALRTPISCASYTAEGELVPWSAPDAPSVTKKSSFAINGGPCPPTPPNNPGFVAGTLEPLAGAYSPFTLKLSREDGSQNLAGFEVTLPEGLSAKLAGVSSCTEAEIAAAKAREHPEEGALELAHPSCPAASEIGTLDVAAGAGPTPLHTAGHLYLAGPYKGAPLSVLAITPAVAGPFDLGAVVVRAALYIDPVTAQGRAVSDPLPQILEGIPLDVRSVSLRMGRPQFTINPTSCEPKVVAGIATSSLGQLAALQSPFQVGACKSLPYKPKLSTRLFGPIHRGGHPRLRSVFTAKPGEANTARISFALPRSEFIDQAHFRTICTRVQFAADQCPAGSVYGHIVASSPLVDYKLEGPIYLRSSSHKLPDVLAALRGPASQPIEIDLDGRVDSVNGGIRTTFETVPDQPVTKAVVTLQGGKKGLFQNSTNICKGQHRATLRLTAQNGKVLAAEPLIKAQCGTKKKAKKGH